MDQKTASLIVQLEPNLKLRFVFVNSPNLNTNFYVKVLFVCICK